MRSLKNTISPGLVLLLAFHVSSHAGEKFMSAEEMKAFYKEAYAHTIQNMHATKQDYADYFSKDFVMYMDGQQYFFDDYVQFMLDINKDSASVNIDFKYMIAEDDAISTVHTTHVTKKNKNELYLDAMSFYKIRDHKFILGRELTRKQS